MRHIATRSTDVGTPLGDDSDIQWLRSASARSVGRAHAAREDCRVPDPTCDEGFKLEGLCGPCRQYKECIHVDSLVSFLPDSQFSAL